MSRRRDTAWRIGGQADGDYEQAQGADGAEARAGDREPVRFGPDEDKSSQGHSRTDDDVAAKGANVRPAAMRGRGAGAGWQDWNVMVHKV